MLIENLDMETIKNTECIPEKKKKVWESGFVPLTKRRHSYFIKKLQLLVVAPFSECLSFKLVAFTLLPFLETETFIVAVYNGRER